MAGMLHTIRRQHSAMRGLPHDGGGEAVTTRDTPLAECILRSIAPPRHKKAGAKRMVAGMLHTIHPQHHAKRCQPLDGW